MLRALVLGVVVGAIAGGCYASHRRGEEPPVPWACEPATLPGAGRATPRGVCFVAGDVVVFDDQRGELACTLHVGDATDFAMAEADAPATGSFRRAVGCCGTSSNPRLVVDAEPFELTLGEGGPPCALVARERPAGEYVAIVPAEVCGDPFAGPGTPVVISIVDATGADGCGGAEFAERCDAWIDGDDVVVRPEVAPAVHTPCELWIVPRVAECVVPPLAPGPHDVVDETGRRLGTVTIPGTLPSHPRSRTDPTCTPVP